MTSLGMSKLAAVNRVARSIGEPPFSALTTPGSPAWPSLAYDGGEAGKLERLLDEALFKVQSAGTPENVVECKAFTAIAGTIAAPSDTLHIVAAGPSRHRRFQLVDGKFYDANAGTDAFGTSEVVYADWYRLIEFDKCSPVLKEAIILEAEKAAQLAYRGDPTIDQIHARNIDRFVPPNAPMGAGPAVPDASRPTFGLQPAAIPRPQGA